MVSSYHTIALESEFNSLTSSSSLLLCTIVVRSYMGQPVVYRVSPLPPHPLDPAPLSAPAVISDAASGGQVLMCATTFSAVKDLVAELGRVTHEGIPLRKATEQRMRPSWLTWGR